MVPSPEAENDARADDPSSGEDAAKEESVSGIADGADAPAFSVTNKEISDAIAERQWETATTTKMGNAIFGRTQVQPSQLMLKDSEIVFSQNDKTLQETFSEKLCSTAEYASVFNGVNVRYDLNSNSLKESVIIASAPTGRTGYQYLLEAKNLVLELQEDNSIYAYATGHAEGDDPVFFMPAPYLFDQEKVYCDDIELMFVAPTLNRFCIQMIGEAEKDKQISQTITVSGRTGDVFSVAGWAMAHSAPVVENSNRRFAIRARFNYTDGTTDSTLVAFNPSTGDYSTWQYVADRIVAKKAYKSITISLLYSYNVNEVYFDGIQLFKEEFGHSYVYDRQQRHTGGGVHL